MMGNLGTAREGPRALQVLPLPFTGFAQSTAPPPTVPEAVARVASLNLTPEALAQHLDVAHYLMSELGALAKKVPVTRLDVMKAVAAAVGARKISVIDGGNFTAGIPDQPDDLRSWLQNLYHVYIIWAVALNAHAHQMIGNPKGMIQ